MHECAYIYIYIHTYIHTCFCVCIPTLFRECLGFVQNNRLPSFPPFKHMAIHGAFCDHMLALTGEHPPSWNHKWLKNEIWPMYSPKRIPPLFHVSLLNFVNLSRHIVNHVSPSVDASFPSKSIYDPIVMLSIYIYVLYMNMNIYLSIWRLF